MKGGHFRLFSSPSFLMAEQASYEKKRINAYQLPRIFKEDNRFLNIN
jgi:hypothetical protein